MTDKIYIKTKGFVGLDLGRFSEVFLEKDIPVDSYGLPYIPLDAAISDDDLKNIEIPLGIAWLENYEGLLSELKLINNLEGVSSKVITELYTQIITNKDGSSCRVLKPGLTFVAEINIDQSKRESVGNALSSIRQIGIVNESISGLVEISVERCPETRQVHQAFKLSEKKKYSRIDYTIEVMSPLCIYTPYEKESKTLSYVSGAEFLEHFQAIASNAEKEILDQPGLKCSNAYPTCDDMRGLPAPMSMVIEKLHKESLWSRLSTPPADKPSLQTVRISGDYVIGYEKKTVSRFSTELTSIYPVQAKSENMSDEDVRDAIKEGQIFKGFILGNDDQIRIIVHLLTQEPAFNIGFYAHEGYGRIIVRIDKVEEQAEVPPSFANVFDVFTVAPVIMYDSNGFYSYSANHFLTLLEEFLDEKGNLEFVRQMSDSELLYSFNKKMESSGSALRCMQPGCSFRIKTKDGRMVNIELLRNAFIGYDSESGFGEITVLPPSEEFYRACEERETDSYTIVKPRDASDLESMAELCQKVLKRILYYKIARIAIVDSEDTFKNKTVPLFILRKLADRYAPSITDRELEALYQEVLEHVAQ